MCIVKTCSIPPDGSGAPGKGPLDWERLYAEFTASVIDGDCATLCRRGPDGLGACCDGARLTLIVFRDELAWARQRTRGWRGGRPRTPAERKGVAAWADHVAWARCLRPRQCDRPYRSLTCRLFPLEPHLDAAGGFLGLTNVYEAARLCPLIRRQLPVRQAFVDQSAAVWRQILAAYPEERACYVRASRQLRSRFARHGRAIRLWRPTDGFVF